MAFEQRCLNDGELIRTILEGSLKDLSGHIQKVRSNLERKEYDGLVRGAHSLKGTSGTLSALRLYETARDLEMNARRAAESPGEITTESPLADTLDRLVSRAGREFEEFRTLIDSFYPAGD